MREIKTKIKNCPNKKKTDKKNYTNKGRKKEKWKEKKKKRKGR